jgi:hypothetical protein
MVELLIRNIRDLGFFRALKILLFGDDIYIGSEKMREYHLDIRKEIGHEEEDFDDPDWNVRLSAYHNLGFCSKALRDPHSFIRSYAYETLRYYPRSAIKTESNKYHKNNAILFWSIIDDTPAEELPKLSISGNGWVTREAARHALKHGKKEIIHAP